MEQSGVKNVCYSVPHISNGLFMTHINPTTNQISGLNWVTKAFGHLANLLNHLVSLAKWLTVRLRTKRLWVRIPFQIPLQSFNEFTLEQCVRPEKKKKQKTNKQTNKTKKKKKKKKKQPH